MTDNPFTTTTARESDCPACDGSGFDRAGSACEVCDGSGLVQLCTDCDGRGDHAIPGPRRTVSHFETCTTCYGYGFLPFEDDRA